MHRPPASPGSRTGGIRTGLCAALVLGLVAAAPGAATETGAEDELVPHQAGDTLFAPLNPDVEPDLDADHDETTADSGVFGAAIDVTLITGDTVRLTDVGDGRRTLELEPGTGRESVPIHQSEIDGELYVFPVDVMPYLAEGELDRDLFNVDLLIDAGYDDASTDALPLITTYAGGDADVFGLSSTAALDGVDVENELWSIGAGAVRVTKDDADDFWVAVTGIDADEAHDPSAHSDEGFTSGVERIWLDRPVSVDLHESTEQIGAPVAWEAGIDGTGVTVAVLDTGVDADHPDLAGQVTQEADFSGSGDPTDRHGHGTHVAATAAGTGAASDGSRPGVAPGATIISGKVLDDFGFGSESGIIAGMEWSVEQEADIINLSLGGDPTDGSDPMSQALNTLSEESGALFVVSAGNSGPGSQTVGSPGSADAALTVGAVDRDDALADFSSRGPRVGDGAVKPDVTAPGVGIVAARAEGTDLGTPVDEQYTSLSGTSMAAPHVAGAAALLAAQHPDWDGDQLKDALISTAVPHPDRSAYEQGSGRIDLSRAITTPVTATGTVHLGTFSDGDTTPATVEVVYTNTGDEDLSLDLSLELSATSGEVPADGAVELSDATVNVPAHDTATVSIVVDPAVLQRGHFTGGILAESGDIEARTTLSVIKTPPTREVSFTGIGRHGDPSFVTGLVLIGEQPQHDVITWVGTDEPRTVTMAEGDYYLHANMSTTVSNLDAGIVVTDPELTIDEHTEQTGIVLDARRATPVRIHTPDPATIRGNPGYLTHREFHGRSVSNRVMKLPNTRSVMVTPTQAPSEGTFEFSSRWQLGAPALIGTVTGDQPSIGLSAPADPLLHAEGDGPTWDRQRPGTLLPQYERLSPALDHDGPLDLVYAGAGTPQDYAGLDVEGKVAVVSLAEKGEEDVEAAVDAGAAALMIAPEKYWYVVYTGPGNRLDLPVMVLSPNEALLVLNHLADSELTMSFTGDPVPDYTYDIMQVSKGSIPARVEHRVSDENSTTIHSNYHHTGGGEWAKEQRFGWLPSQSTTIVETQNEVYTPHQRTEIVSSGDPDTVWLQRVLHFFSWDSMNPIRDGAHHPLRSYDPGEEVTHDWYRSVIRPAVASGSDPVRTGDVLTLQIPEQATGTTMMRGQASMTLRQNGTVLHEDTAAWGSYPLGDGPVELDLSVVRDSDADWQFSTQTDTTWSFDSSGVGDDVTTVLPMLSIDYDVPVDLRNSVSAGSTEELGLSVRHPAGLDDAPSIDSAQAWVSYDEGETWQEVDVVPSGGQGTGDFTVLVDHPQEHESVSLRVGAEDSGGNTIEQTVVRAYGIEPDAG